MEWSAYYSVDMRLDLTGGNLCILLEHLAGFFSELGPNLMMIPWPRHTPGTIGHWPSEHMRHSSQMDSQPAQEVLSFQGLRSFTVWRKLLRL